MKATLLAILTLGSLAMAESASTYKFDSTPAGATSQYSTWKGITINLDKTHDGKSYDISMPAGALTLPNSLFLDTFTVFTDGNGYAEGMKALLLDGNKTVLGVSSGATIETGTGWRPLTFDFTNASTPVTLSTGTQYYVMWAKSQKDNVSEALVGTMLTSFDQYTGGDKLRVAYSQNYSTVTNDNGLGYTEGVTSNWTTPAVTVTTHNSNVPEPTTGSLSLLALAGLCIRRRK